MQIYTKEGLNVADFFKAKEGYLKNELSEDYTFVESNYVVCR